MKIEKEVNIELERWKKNLSKEEFEAKFPYYQPELLTKEKAARKIVEYFNMEEMGGSKWDSLMYQQKVDVMILLDKIKRW